MDAPLREPAESLDYGCVIGLLELDLRLPECRSLKTKRGILARTVNHLRKLHPVSIAEVEAHDTWGRAGLAAVTVSRDRALVERVLMAVVRAVEHDRDVELIRHCLRLF